MVEKTNHHSDSGAEVAPRSASIADRRAQATREAVLEVAWELSRRVGLTGWSMRKLAAEVGLAAPTLYAYFENKNAIYDAMFRQGYEQVDEVAARWAARPGSIRADFVAFSQDWFDFCTSDPTRYQLMYQRVVPGFEPSADAYAASLASYERFRAQFAAMGVAADAHLDLWTAIATGLSDQQISNDPGGDRWRRLLPQTVHLYCDHVGIPPDTD